MNPPRSEAKPTPGLHLHIERLVLDGLPFTGREAGRFQASFEAELARLAAAGIGSGAFPPSGGASPSLPAAAMQFDPSAGPVVGGRHAAAALYQRICPAASRPTA